MSEAERDRFRYLLPAPKCLGRGIEVVALLPDERDQAHDAAARLMEGTYEKDSIASERRYNTIAGRECYKRMLRAVTKLDGFKMPASKDPREVLAKDGLEWIPLNLDTLETHPTYNFAALFLKRCADIDALRAIFADLHGFPEGELATITGKALPVAGGASDVSP